jgi:signal transduction histidine kinase
MPPSATAPRAVIAFPLARASAGGLDSPTPMNDPAPATDVHILIVEDSATQACNLQHLLLQHFGKVSVAADGAAALALIEAEPPTLVVTDVHMPGIDGYELCRRIKADPRFAAIPVILTTTLRDAGDVMRGLECGANGFISKPCDREHLLTRIRVLLANPVLRSSGLPREAKTVEIVLGGETFSIESSREQILDFLLSTYEVALGKNRELQAVTDRLAAQTAELVRSNAELEQFAYIASHDLQEPLRMVTSYMGMLANRAGDRLDEKEKRYMGHAVDGARRMQQMISDLLAYSRVSTHGGKFAQADLSAILENALANLEIARRECDARITHDQLPTLQVDASQFTQLFQNLIANALKFTAPDRQPAVHIGCRRRNGDWEFSVRDNGIGIAEQDYERIFQLFQRLHGRSEYPGTGIGLAVCKKIVERHGGRIWLESEAEKGTTFFFTVPVTT